MARQLLLVLSMMGTQACFAVDPSWVSVMFPAEEDVLEGEANTELYELPTGQAQFEKLQHLATSLEQYHSQVWRKIAEQVLQQQKNRAASHLSQFLAAADSSRLDDEQEWLRFSLILRAIIVTYVPHMHPVSTGRASPTLHIDAPPPYY